MWLEHRTGNAEVMGSNFALKEGSNFVFVPCIFPAFLYIVFDDVQIFANTIGEVYCISPLLHGHLVYGHEKFSLALSKVNDFTKLSYAAPNCLQL